MENVILIVIGIFAVLMLPFAILFLAALIAMDVASRIQHEEDQRPVPNRKCK